MRSKKPLFNIKIKPELFLQLNVIRGEDNNIDELCRKVDELEDYMTKKKMKFELFVTRKKKSNKKM